MATQAYISEWVSNGKDSKILRGVVAVVSGIALLSALAQIQIPLPFTPVPITGQTFGVMLVSLLWGRMLGFATVASYVGLGSAGLPIFAGAAGGLHFVSAGYLIGMCVAAFVVGGLADRGWTKTFPRALLACFVGSACVYSCGLIVLAKFVPTKSLLMAGFIPFIPGDILKSVLASAIASRATKKN